MNDWKDNSPMHVCNTVVVAEEIDLDKVGCEPTPTKIPHLRREPNSPPVPIRTGNDIVIEEVIDLDKVGYDPKPSRILHLCPKPPAPPAPDGAAPQA